MGLVLPWSCSTYKRKAAAVGQRPAEVCGCSKSPASPNAAITLRMVAALIPSLLSNWRATAWEATGSPVAMYSSMIALRTNRSRGLIRRSGDIAHLPYGAHSTLLYIFLQRKLAKIDFKSLSVALSRSRPGWKGRQGEGGDSSKNHQLTNRVQIKVFFWLELGCCEQGYPQGVMPHD